MCVRGDWQQPTLFLVWNKLERENLAAVPDLWRIILVGKVDYHFGILKDIFERGPLSTRILFSRIEHNSAPLEVG